MARKKKTPAVKKAPVAVTEVEVAVETPAVEVKEVKVKTPTARMRAIQFLTERGPGEFTVPEIRDALEIKQQHAFSVVAGLVETGVAKRLEAIEDRARGKRGTYNFEPKWNVNDEEGKCIEPFMTKAAASQKAAKVKASGKKAVVAAV